MRPRICDECHDRIATEECGFANGETRMYCVPCANELTAALETYANDPWVQIGIAITWPFVWAWHRVRKILAIVGG